MGPLPGQVRAQGLEEDPKGNTGLLLRDQGVPTKETCAELFLIWDEAQLSHECYGAVSTMLVRSTYSGWQRVDPLHFGLFTNMRQACLSYKDEARLSALSFNCT